MKTHAAALLALFALLCIPATGQELGGHVTFTDSQGRVWADSSQFRACFTREGVHLSVPAQEGSKSAPELELRFAAAVRGNQPLEVNCSVEPEQTGDRVEFLRGGLVERYQIEDHGFEQSFLVPHAPGGTGDLRLSLRVGGNVTSGAFKPAHRAITFRHADHNVIRYGEAHVLDRGGRHLKLATAYDGQGQLELIVPSSFLEQATYPVIIDPAVGPVVNPGGAAYDDSNPDVSFDQHYNRLYHVVWERRFSNGDVVLRTQTFDRDGVATTGVRAITNSGVATNPACYCNGSVLVVFEANGRIEGARISTSTTGLPTPWVISNPAAGEHDQRPAVTGNHWFTEYLVAWDRTPAGGTNPTQIVARQHTYWGSTPSAERVLESVPASAGHVRGVRLPKNCGMSRYFALPGVTEQMLHRAVWDRFYVSPAPGDYDVRTCSFQFSDTPPTVFQMIQAPVTVAGGIGTDELAPSIGSRCYDQGVMNYCIAWEGSGDVRARMYDQNGPKGSAFDVRATPDYQGMPAVGAGSCNFTVAYGEIAAGAGFAVDVRAARVLDDGTVTVSDRPIDVGTGVYQSHIRASSCEWLGESMNSSFIVWDGQTGPVGGGISDVHGRVFEPVDALTNYFGSACAGPGGELPQISVSDKPLPGEVVTFRATNAPPNAIGVLFCSTVLLTAPLPGAPGCNAYMGMPFVASWGTYANSSGNAGRSLQMPCHVLTPATLAFQWAFLTPGHNALGLITSNDMDVTWVE